MTTADVKNVLRRVGCSTSAAAVHGPTAVRAQGLDDGGDGRFAADDVAVPLGNEMRP